jgi:hypothetical protein
MMSFTATRAPVPVVSIRVMNVDMGRHYPVNAPVGDVNAA